MSAALRGTLSWLFLPHQITDICREACISQRTGCCKGGVEVLPESGICKSQWRTCDSEIQTKNNARSVCCKHLEAHQAPLTNPTVCLRYPIIHNTPTVPHLVINSLLIPPACPSHLSCSNPVLPAISHVTWLPHLIAILSLTLQNTYQPNPAHPLPAELCLSFLPCRSLCLICKPLPAPSDFFLCFLAPAFLFSVCFCFFRLVEYLSLLLCSPANLAFCVFRLLSVNFPHLTLSFLFHSSPYSFTDPNNVSKYRSLLPLLNFGSK